MTEPGHITPTMAPAWIWLLRAAISMWIKTAMASATGSCKIPSIRIPRIPKYSVIGCSKAPPVAAPHVAGVAALLMAHGNATTPDEIRTALQETARDLGNTEGWEADYGWGLVNAYAALQWQGEPNEAPTAPTIQVDLKVTAGGSRTVKKNTYVWANATVTVEGTVSATVEGHWSGASSDVDSGTTAEGIVSFDSNEVKKTKNPLIFTFEVDKITIDNTIYTPVGLTTASYTFN